MWESLARVNAVVGGVVWGPVGLTLLFGTGCLLTVRTGFFQLRYFGGTPSGPSSWSGM